MRQSTVLVDTERRVTKEGKNSLANYKLETRTPFKMKRLIEREFGERRRLSVENHSTAECNYNSLPKVGYELQPRWSRNLYDSVDEIAWRVRDVERT